MSVFFCFSIIQPIIILGGSYMNDKIKLFEMHLKEEEKAENTINKYLHDIKEFYNWFKLVGAKLGELCFVGEFH